MTNNVQENVFKIFGNRERVQLLSCLTKPICVTELLQKCHLSQSALSQHLRILRLAKAVECVRDGKKQIYSITDKNLLKIANELLKY